MEQDQELIEKVRDKIVPLMKDFDTGNRGNRLSKEIIAGFGGFLENVVMELLKENLDNRKENLT